MRLPIATCRQRQQGAYEIGPGKKLYLARTPGLKRKAGVTCLAEEGPSVCALRRRGEVRLESRRVSVYRER